MSTPFKESQSSIALQDTLSAGLNVFEEYIIKIAIIEVPILGLPVIKQIFTYILSKILNKVEAEGQLLIAFKMIDIEIDNQVQEYKDSIEILKKKLEEGVSDDEKEKARQLAREKLRALIRMPTK